MRGTSNLRRRVQLEQHRLHSVPRHLVTNFLLQRLFLNLGVEQLAFLAHKKMRRAFSQFRYLKNANTCKQLQQLVDAQKYDEAIVQCQAFVQQNLYNQEETEVETQRKRLNKSMGQYMLALTYWKKNMRMEAKDAIDSALAVDSQNPYALLLKALLFPTRQLMNQAQASWQTLKKEPYCKYAQLSTNQFADSYVLQAQWYKQSQDYTNAIDYFQRAIDAGIVDAQVYLDKAWCHFHEEEHSLAEYCIDRAVQLSKEHVNMVMQRLLMRAQFEAPYCDMDLLFHDYDACKAVLPQSEHAHLASIMCIALETQQRRLQKKEDDYSVSDEEKQTILHRIQRFAKIPDSQIHALLNNK